MPILSQRSLTLYQFVISVSPSLSLFYCQHFITSFLFRLFKHSFYIFHHFILKKQNEAKKKRFYWKFKFSIARHYSCRYLKLNMHAHDSFFLCIYMCHCLNEDLHMCRYRDKNHSKFTPHKAQCNVFRNITRGAYFEIPYYQFYAIL